MKLLEVAETTLTPDVQKKATRTLNAARKEIARYSKAKIELKPVKPNKAEIIVEMQKFMHQEDIKNTY